MHGVPRDERARRVREAAKLLDLEEFLDRKPRNLSGGQRQRVAMGRAIVREPSVFLMDEPLSNLDAKLRVQMRSEVLRVHKEIGAATLYVTHDQVEAMTMGDRVAVLNAGVLQQYARPRELYDRPANLFVAGFIGSPEMNLYEASVSDGELVLGSQRLALGAVGAAETVLASYRGRKVIAGLRPEDLGMDGAGGADVDGDRDSARASDDGGGGLGELGVPGSDNGAGGRGGAALVADVRVVEPLGSETHVFFAIDATPVGASMIAAAEAEAGAGLLAGHGHNGVARLDPRSGVRPGQRVTFRVDPGRLHFFDPDTGAAVR
jgi:multiple sugar transport system ATP-binding protein